MAEVAGMGLVWRRWVECWRDVLRPHMAVVVLSAVKGSEVRTQLCRAVAGCGCGGGYGSMGMLRLGVQGGMSSGGCTEDACSAVLSSWRQAGRGVRDVKAGIGMESSLAEITCVCPLR